MYTAYIYIYVCVCVRVCMYIYMCVCMYVCMYVYKIMYNSINNMPNLVHVFWNNFAFAANVLYTNPICSVCMTALMLQQELLTFLDGTRAKGNRALSCWDFAWRGSIIGNRSRQATHIQTQQPSLSILHSWRQSDSFSSPQPQKEGHHVYTGCIKLTLLLLYLGYSCCYESLCKCFLHQNSVHLVRWLLILFIATSLKFLGGFHQLTVAAGFSLE